MKNLLLTAVAAIAFSGFSQNYDLKWGPVIKSKEMIFASYLANGNSFSLQVLGNLRYGEISHYNDLNLTSKTLYKPVVDKKNAEYESQIEFEGKILIFSSLEDKGESTLYVHEFKKSDSPIELEGKKVASTHFKDDRYGPRYTFVVSPDKQKVCVSYKSSDGVYGYFILNKDLQVESEGTFKITLEENGETIQEYILSNEGEMFLTTRVYKKDELSSTKLYKVTGNDAEVVDLGLQGDYITRLNISEDKKGNLLISGLYGKTKDYEGVFFRVIDTETGKILNSGFHELEDTFVNGADLRNLYIRHFIQTKDGGFFYVAEFSSSHRSSSGTASYCHSDLVFLKLNGKGEMVWRKIIPKTQDSMGSEVIYSSFAMTYTEDHAYLLFNDNIKNYDPASKKFSNNKDLESIRPNEKESIIAYVKLNLETGELERSLLSSGESLSTCLVSKVCFAKPGDVTMTIFIASRTLQRVGSVTFK